MISYYYFSLLLKKKKNPKILLFPLHEQVRRLAEIKKNNIY